MEEVKWVANEPRDWVLGAPVAWERLPASHPFAGVTAYRFDTAYATVVRYEIQPGAAYPPHSHPEEQVVHVLAGEMEFWVDGRGVRLRSGDTLYVPGGAEHGSRVEGPDPVTFLVVVVPRRQGAGEGGPGGVR